MITLITFLVTQSEHTLHCPKFNAKLFSAYRCGVGEEYNIKKAFLKKTGWSGGVMVLEKLPVPGRPANLDSNRPGRVAQSGYILSFLLPLMQEGQLSVTG